MTTDQAMHAIDPNSVRKVVSVQAPLMVAWQVFTEHMGTWWPLANYKIGKAKAVDAVIEPRVGGRWRRWKHLRLGPRTLVGTAIVPGAVLGHQRRLAA